MDGFVLQVRKSWRLYTVIPLFSFQNWALLHPFLNMFTKSVKHVSIGLKKTECYSIYSYPRSTYPFSWPFPIFSISRNFHLGLAVWEETLNPALLPGFAKSSGGVGTLKVGKPTDLMWIPSAIKPRACSGGRSVWISPKEKVVTASIWQTQKKMALFIKLCLCENAALLHLWHKNTNKIQFATKCQSTTSCNYRRNRHRQSLSTSWLFMTFLQVFSQSLILQSSLKYLTSTNCCGSGSPWAKKTNGLNSWDFSAFETQFHGNPHNWNWDMMM